jgi:hypothetical protein
MSKEILRQNAVSIGTNIMTDRKPLKHRTPRRAASEAKAPRLGRDIQVRIGDKLRAMYDEVVEQGVPDRFATLLRQFDDEPADKKK